MKTHSMQCSRCIVIVSVMTLLVSMPTWAKRENEADLSQLRFRYEEEGLYSDIVSGGGSLSGHGSYINFVVLQVGRHWPKPIGLEGALMESIIESLAEEHRAIRSWLPLGIYIPILTFDWPRRDLGSTLNLAARAHLLPRYNYYLPGNGSTEGASDSASFPKFFDVCLEWRGPFHTISLGYRHQTKPFEYESGGWPHGLNMSGVFASVRVGISSAATEIVEKRLSNSLTEKIEVPYYEGEDFYNQRNFHEAMQKWKQAHEIAENGRAKRWSCFLLAKLGDAHRADGNYQEALSYYRRAREIYKQYGIQKWYLPGDDSQLVDEWATWVIGKSFGDLSKDIEDTSQQAAFSYHKLVEGLYGAQYGITEIKELDEILRDSWDREEIRKTSTDLSKDIEDDSKAAADTYLDSGDYHYNRDDYAKAISHYKRAVEIYKKLGDKGEIIRSLTGLGDAYWAPGDGYGRLRAILRYQEALNIYEGAERIDDQGGIAMLFGSIGNACVSNGNYPAAIHYYEQALEISKFKKRL